jgi:dienelactone hydrolase
VPGIIERGVKCLLASLCAAIPLLALGADTSASLAPGKDTPYAVGSVTRFIHDTSRPYDSVAGVDTGIRTLITEVWYPVERPVLAAEPQRYRRATYGDYVFGNRSVHRLMMTETTFFHMTPATVREGVSAAQVEAAIDELFERPRHSYVDAPLAGSPARLPVVVMSHGDAGSRYNMETVCEYLAAHGYVVVAPEHTGNSPYSMTGADPALESDADFRQKMQGVLALLDEHGTYGSRETYGQSYSPLSGSGDPVQEIRDLDRSLLQRLRDLGATLDEIERWNLSGRFAGRLALDRVGLVGRSFGGSTTLVGLALEPRFSAGFAVVPPGWTDPRGSLPASALVADGEDSVLLSASGDSPIASLSKPTFLLSGAEDALIIGLSAQRAAASGGVQPTPDNPHPALRAAYEDTQAPVVWGLLAESNHSTLGVSGGYWWPSLKPDTQQRYFEPRQTFRLMSPALAQRMQREKALAFFDLTIRRDAAARARLLDPAWQARGLTLEARNW